MTSTTNHYHHPDNLTNYSHPGGGTMTGGVWQPASNTPTRTCRNCLIPAGESPTISHHWHSPRGSWGPGPLWDNGVLCDDCSPIQAPNIGINVPWHPNVHTKHCGHGTWPQSVWLPYPHPTGDNRFRLITLPNPLVTICPRGVLNSFTIWHAHHDISYIFCTIVSLTNYAIGSHFIPVNSIEFF